MEWVYKDEQKQKMRELEIFAVAHLPGISFPCLSAGGFLLMASVLRVWYPYTRSEFCILLGLFVEFLFIYLTVWGLFFFQ